MEFQAEVKSADGATIGVSAKEKVPSTYFPQPLTIGNPPSSAYCIEGTLWKNGRILEKKNAELTILSDAECSVYINEEKNLIVEGKEFFLIGICHIKPSDIPQTAEIGFNTVPMFK